VTDDKVIKAPHKKRNPERISEGVNIIGVFNGFISIIKGTVIQSPVSLMIVIFVKLRTSLVQQSECSLNCSLN